MCKMQRKILALLLSVALLLSCFPIVTSAYEGTQTEIIEETSNKTTDTNADITATNQLEKPYILSELIEKRESNVKHFRMSDGSYTAAVYPYDVHFKDVNGEFQDIDNSLSLGNDGENDVLSNKNNLISVKFMKKSNPNKLYAINTGEHKIKVSIDGVSKVNAVEYTKETNIDNSKFELKNIGSRVTYTDILNNTDIEFTLKSTELKENIILKKQVDFNSLTYTYHLNGGLTAIQTDDKNIIITDNNGNFVFNISAPAMWDNNGNYSEDLNLEIIETKNSKIKIKLSWNISENAEYPVIIDPVMSATVDRNQIQDTHIIASNPNANYDVNNHIRVRNDGYAMLRFPTPTLTSGDKIVNAQLALAPYGAYDTTDVKYSNVNSFNPKLYITAHKILRTWEETTATYNNVNPENGFYDSTVQSYCVVDNDSHYYYWDITRLVNEWTEHYSDNYGLLLKYAAPPSDGSVFDSFFCSTNGKYLPEESWPQLIYQYVNTIGVEDYYSYHTQSLGYAGTGYTSDLSGNLTVINEVYNSGGSLMPVSVSLVYNLSNVNKSVTPYGKGWRLNWAQNIDWSVKSNYDDTPYAKYTDGDGTEHYFMRDTSTEICTDEINPDRKIYFIASTGDYKMTDSSGTNMYFSRNGSLNEWYLYRIEDAYGNYIQITLNSSNLNRVDKVYSSTGNVVDFVYNESGLLSGVKYYDEDLAKTITFGYNNHVTTPNNCISDIYYPDGTSAQYHYYDATARLSKSVDINGQSIVYGYSQSSPFRVNRVAEYSSASELGAEMTIYYQTTATLFTDKTNNRKYLYTFAQNGTIKSVVDTTANDGNGYGQYYEYNNGITTETTGTGNLTSISKTQKSTVNLLKNHSFESTGEHSFTAWNETTGTASGGYSTEKSHIGSRSYKITRPASSNCSRAIGFYNMYIENGKTYTLSAYVNTSGMTSTGNGASLMIIGSEENYESEYITEAVDKWQRLSLTFTAKKSENVSICMNLSGATGSVYFDNIQLEVGNLSEYNLLENAGFEQDSTQPIGWHNWGELTASITSGNSIGGTYSVKFDGNPSKRVEYAQVISVPNGKSGDTYVASAFAKANSIPADGWKFTILVRFMKNGNKVNDQNILFNAYTTEWQKVSGAAKATGDYDNIFFFILYYYNCNTVYFDNMQLINDTFGNTYTYDSNGNLTSTADLQSKKDYTFEYDGNNQLIKESNISGGKILYTYNLSNAQQLDIATAGGTSTYYDYDSHGNAVTASTYGSELVDGKYYYIRNLYHNKYIDTVNYGTANGTAIKYCNFGQNSAQRWKLIKNSDGTYSLSPECAPNSLLSVEPSNLSNHARVALYSIGAVSYQKFNLNRLNGNIYRLDVANAGYSLDGNASNCYVYESHLNEYQQFVFYPANRDDLAETPSITSSATYTANGRNTKSTTDSRGYTTTYDYHPTLNHLLSQTAPNGVSTSYSYKDNSYLLESVTSGGTTVSYDYDNAKRLSSITSPSGTNYSFQYNSYGRTTDIKVGSRTLSSNVYDNAKGLLDYTTYGNGTIIDYSYDALGRQTSTSINNVLRYNKLYDSSSRLLEVKDILLGKKIKYQYDILDRAVSESLMDTLTNRVYAKLGIRYDDTKNRIAGYDVNIDGINKATDFVYGENKANADTVSSVKHNNTTKLSYGYDSLSRLATRTVATGTPFATEYTYTEGSKYMPVDFDMEKAKGRITTGDFNGDGRDDIAAIYDAGYFIIEIKVWLSTENGFSEMQTWNRTAQYSPNYITGRVVSGDFNGDGKDDLAAIYNYPDSVDRIHIFTSSGSSFPYWEVGYSFTAGYDVNNVTNRVVAGDFNGDGKDDIATIFDFGNYVAGVHTFLSTGSGFTNTGYNQDIMQYSASNITNRVVAGDFNNDGKDDIAAIYDYNLEIHVHLFPSQNGAFPTWNVLSPKISQYNPNYISGRVAAGDFNGDGNLDIAAIYNYDGYGKVHLFASNGTAMSGWSQYSFSLGKGYPVESIGGMVSGNYNNDSYTDIAVLFKTGNTSAELHTIESSSNGMGEYEVWWNSVKNTSTSTGSTTTLIKTVKNGNDTLEYAYDSMGNITSIKKNNNVIETYTYDELNQLKTVTKGTDVWEYTYDNGGNILSVKKNGVAEKTYTYGDSEWKDLLTNFNGTNITYDTIGNPLSYRNGMNFTWADGRKLAGITKGTDSISYTYDANGLRNTKTVNGTTTQYYWLNGMLQGQKTGSEYIIFLYDESGTAYGFLLKNGATEEYYYYIFNAQGDVIGILDSTGTQVVEYTYNAWGELLSTTGTMANTIGQINPIRYRGYYYDGETGFYLTGTRYYDPEIGRFINADGQINDDILGTNLFAYCGNNPVTRADDTGRGWWVVAGALIGGIAGGVTKIVSNVTTGKKWNEGVIGATVGGAVYGGVLAATGNVWAAGFASAAAESLTNEVVSYIPKVSQANGQTVTKKVTTGNVIDSTKTVLNDTAVNGTISAVTGKIAGKIVPTNNGWFKPQKFVSSFAGKYAIKSELQTLTQSGLLFGVEGLKYSFNQRLKQGQQPIVTFFPDTEIRAAG